MTTLGRREKCLRNRSEKGISERCVPIRCETGSSRRRWKHRGPIPAETLAERGRPAYTGVGIGESKRKSWVKCGSGHGSQGFQKPSQLLGAGERE